jgi:hypothetical protein
MLKYILLVVHKYFQNYSEFIGGLVSEFAKVYKGTRVYKGALPYVSDAIGKLSGPGSDGSAISDNYLILTLLSRIAETTVLNSSSSLPSRK